MEYPFSLDYSSLIKDNLARLNDRITGACKRSGREPDTIRTIAISKNFPADIVKAAYHCGLRYFGENRIQEATRKFADLSDIRDNVELHLVGHLQSNKIRDAIEVFDIIHSLDSLKLARYLNDRVSAPVKLLVQVNVAGEETKSGLSAKEVVPAVEAMQDLPKLHIIGLMTIAPIASNAEDIRPVFSQLRQIRDYLGLQELSMGMTDDYEVAIEEGSTMIRIGRAIFGERRDL